MVVGRCRWRPGAAYYQDVRQTVQVMRMMVWLASCEFLVFGLSNLTFEFVCVKHFECLFTARTNCSCLEMFYLNLRATIKQFDFLYLARPLNVSRYKVT